MRRRDFVRHSAVGGAALLGGGLPGLGLSGPHAVPSESELTSGSENAAFDLEEATILGLQRDMVTGRRTALSITQQYLERIESLDHRGPPPHHMPDINPDAPSIAASPHRERAEPRLRGPLNGTPLRPNHTT